MIALIALAAAAATPQPGTLKTFGDWTVGCDNGRACQAVGLMPEGELEGATITVERGAEANAVPRITIATEVPATGLAIDDALSAYTIRRGDGFFEIPTKDTIDFAYSLSRSRTITLVDAKDKPLQTVSLAGASAALRYIDDQQRRAGTATALVARGPAPATRVPPPPSLPVLVRPAAGTAPPPRVAPMTAVRAARIDTKCGTGFKPEITVARLDPATSIVVVEGPCDSGAYNRTSEILVANNAGRLTPALFETKPGWGEDANQIVNGGWDAKARTLTSYVKARGLGDCGVIDRWAWTGKRFDLAARREMGECRGSIDYIPTWRTTLR